MKQILDTIEFPPGREPETKFDPITAQVIAGALDNIGLEMGHKLTRMSYSSIIRESEDFGAALLDPQGRQLCECALSTPLQLGPIPGYMRGILRLFEERGDTIYPGDVIIHNSPYHGASHGPDVGFCVPVFQGDRLIGFSFTTAHVLDIGSLRPGSCGIVDAVHCYAEGLQFKAIKCYEKGQKNEWVWRMIRDNVRASDLVVGDMEAQVAAARVGAERFIQLVNDYGYDTVMAASEELMNYSERMLRQEIEKLPDGTYTASRLIDGFLDDPDPRLKDLPIVVTVTIEGSNMTVDLTGTAPQIAERAINMPLIGTVDVAVYVTLRSILLDSATHEYVPQNSGLVRPIKIIAPRGSLVNPTFPCATIARACPGNFVCDTLMRALAQVCPEKVSAGIGNMKATAYSGVVNGNYWVHIDIQEGSYGGRLGKDGVDSVDTLFANTRNNPIEDIESHLPLRVTRYELREGKAAPGKWRGGIGSLRETQFLTDAHVSLEGEGHKHAPWGAFGGLAGTTGSTEFVSYRTEEVEVLPSKIPSRFAQAGDIYRDMSPCGGGYGPPWERDAQKVLDDVIDEIVTVEQARQYYGVAIRPSARTLTIDAAETERLRAALAAGSVKN